MTITKLISHGLFYNKCEGSSLTQKKPVYADKMNSSNQKISLALWTPVSQGMSLPPVSLLYNCRNGTNYIVIYLYLNAIWGLPILIEKLINRFFL